ncbi:head-tail connector protein [Gordonia phage MichaelScott]|nr:head-tail connector protein [Gordonia phage MichaelScott]YP_010654640.1 head-tail connector protein [Gordonia phage Easley]AWN05033.1 hypothetical protein SEA_EASLEY_8 [Gordonia phage Easley]QOC56250.1 hypothetical protein SEA_MICHAELSCOTT_8 [Gordonia phage MichaelScott]
MSYEVTAPLVVAADPEGKLKYHYQGAIVEYLSDEDAERFLDGGMVVDLGDDEIGVEPVAVPAPEPVGDRPPKTASKEAWVEYAIAKHGFTREDAEAASKADLQELG